jgi:endonuclease/exonuclease/phosphatase (EEP) superfamily protein YafD
LKYLVILASTLLYGCVSLSQQPLLIDDSAGQKVEYCDSRAAVAGLESSTGQGALNPQSISILNWNIHKNKANNWSEDFKLLADQQDIVIIQEAYLNSTLLEALSQQNMRWSVIAAYYRDNKPTGVLTASAVEPYYSCGFLVSEPIIRVPKSTLINYYKMEGVEQSLLVINVHGINFTLGTATYKKQINRLKKYARLHDGPMLIAGDFNSWSKGRDEIINEILADISLQSSRLDNSNQTRIFGKVVDRVYYRGLEPIFQESVPVTSSDHNPILMRFRLVLQDYEGN